ncbi:hypothetical protein HL657_01990 [Methanoculleus sp. YWC-01]|jgi:hypothetical protein|uniref:Uncharacterized protein n=1 Tax=Methanoculleus nereidis TaxID=2735141 RepID=A0ABU3YZH6_9EURY|nr:hypothetical protein [Methanoculleus sp. YWC-01]MCK9298330.1 hypothetical protein [Methanoculleus sp.]MDV4341968.1 hypothetical protein [Methanoculleus sp. YWC-01]
MEEEIRAARMKTPVTIARALSYLINGVVVRAGTLTNNINICGGFGSMNV